MREVHAGGVSIYQHLVRQGGPRLPDEDRLAARGAADPTMAAGARDGLRGRHQAVEAGTRWATLIADALQRATAPLAGRRGRQEVAELIARVDDPLGVIDPLLDELVTRGRLRGDRLRDLAREIATNATERNAVKIAIALLGLAGLTEADRDLLMTLGRHDEFTLYTAIALAGGLPDPEPSLWELGRSVTGWGRIQVVERLTGTRDPDIRAWLLREGCFNTVLVRYTALTAAATGGLADALRPEQVDDALMAGARAILSALLHDGPGEGIDEYADGPRAVSLYLGHVRRRPADPDDVPTVAAVRSFLTQDVGWYDRIGAGWTLGRRTDLEQTCRAILERPEYPGLVREGLGAGDEAAFWSADDAARVLGIPTFEVHLRRLAADPRRRGSWYRAATQAEPGPEAERLVELAERVLPLGMIASGPARHPATGPQYEAHRVLDTVLRGLARFPGLGWPLVAAGLASPVVVNRLSALNVLERWGRRAWPEQAVPALAEAVAAEPDDHVRRRLDGLVG